MHTHPKDGSGHVVNPSASLTLSNLDSLNEFANSGADVYLTSNEGIQALPSWFQGTRPQSSDGTTPSTVASVIITVSKPNNTLDAFYFYFYAYNQGNWVLGLESLEFGDHVGDWEHTMVRFVDSVPQAVWFSQHSSGQAFTYNAVEKASDGVRPVVYVANGSHANYAISGPHDHTIPGFNTPVGPLTDHTDNGVFWDPLPGAYMYELDAESGSFTSYNGVDPTGWLQFSGRWGDNQLPDDAEGQINVFGQRKYVAGPTGPKDKDLARNDVCPDDEDNCLVMPILVPRSLKTKEEE
ncbi:uncharacterized protein Z518_03852 [Rhinocladiella mackenziei CBS 650.93]|uniref:Vacuolar protein sorting-associated protein 62 n=1 Tax=Rhinocladiella mackenziei CBS 650.93 TaxID=1442369 RepID=A0A0D2IJI7_9EURO|nr:uncharacterized protein Z518_03852 [Rhinocladiella mackenziei CBS 650.93]KIX05879.1 hypothetical protein Z518_03852 [Rhinocladiella mackenziei CBS 650.93]